MESSLIAQIYIDVSHTEGCFSSPAARMDSNTEHLDKMSY